MQALQDEFPVRSDGPHKAVLQPDELLRRPQQVRALRDHEAGRAGVEGARDVVDEKVRPLQVPTTLMEVTAATEKFE